MKDLSPSMHRKRSYGSDEPLSAQTQVVWIVESGVSEQDSSVPSNSKPETVKIRTEKDYFEELKTLRDTLNQRDKDVDLLVKVVSALKQEKQQLKEKLQEEKCRLTFRSLCAHDNAVQHYTGLADSETFDFLLSLFETPLVYRAGWNVSCLSKEEQLYLTLLKLKCNPTRQMISDWFRVSCATATNVIISWAHGLHSVLVEKLLKNVPSREENMKTLPLGFDKYENCRMILDCQEISLGQPETLNKYNLTHTHYEAKLTMKGLIGTAPDGTITYVSDLYPGATSICDIVEACGVLQEFVSGDLVMADERFLIKNLLPSNVELHVLPSLRNSSSASARELSSIAKMRLPTERAVQKLRKWRVLDKIPHFLVPHATQVWKACAALSLLRQPGHSFDRN